jgi:hypothetical protein
MQVFPPQVNNKFVLTTESSHLHIYRPLSQDLRPAKFLFGGLEQVRVKFFHDFEKALKAKWLSIVNPRPEDPANINLTFPYVSLAPKTGILLP